MPKLAVAVAYPENVLFANKVHSLEVSVLVNFTRITG